MEQIEILENLLEGINDPGIFKAVFTAGGPGSGKSTVAKNLGLFALGLRPINSDTAFENALKKAGMSLKLDDVDPEIIDTMRVKAKSISAKQMELAIKGRLGLVIDSTARNVSKIMSQKAALEKLGYDTAMLFVDTSLDTALERNKMRERSVPENVVKKSHKEIRTNRDKLKKAFGKDMIIIPNDGDLKDLEKNTTKVFSKVSSWTKKLPKNSQAKKWVDQYKKKVSEMENIDEINRQNQAKRQTSRTSDNLAAYEKKLFKKMLENPKRAKMELDVAIKTFQRQLKGALPITKPLIQAQLDKFTQLASMVGSNAVTEEEIFEKLNFKLPNMKSLQKDPKTSGVEIDKIVKDLEKVAKKFAGSAVGKAMQAEIDQWKRMKAYAMQEAEENTKFSDDQLNMLRKTYGKIKKIDPNSPTLKKMKKFLSNMDKERLSVLANAKPPIPWISMLARFAMNEQWTDENIEAYLSEKNAPYQVKFAKSRKGKISVVDYDDLEDAQKFLADVRKQGFNGIVSQNGKPIKEEGTTTANIPQGPESVAIKPDSTFSGTPVFDCDNGTFSKCLKGKKKYGRWASYLGKDNPFYGHMKNWMAQSYKHKNFILRNKSTGEMVYARKVMGENINESMENLPLSKKEESAFKAAVSKFKGLRPIGSPKMTANSLVQEMQVTEGLDRKKVKISFKKAKDVFSVGQSYYDIRFHPNKSSSQATQSRKFVKQEDLAILKSELKRFENTVLAKGLLNL